MTLTPDDYAFFRTWLHERTGLALHTDKTYLLESRLRHLMDKRGVAHLGELARALRQAPDPALTHEVIDAMMTNETLFFRDIKLFDHFRTVQLPDLMRQRQTHKCIKIWSAACATGQEPYSLAMTLEESLPPSAGWRVDILATDISDAALERARAGEFSAFEIQRGLPPHMAEKYFTATAKHWKAGSAIRNRIRFEKFNLLGPMTQMGTFDVIFCRNVLIYFDEDTKKRVLGNIVAQLAPGGYLAIGSAETAIRLCTTLKAHPECPGLYSRIGG